MKTSLKILMMIHELTTEQLAKTLDIPTTVIDHWDEYGISETDPCFPILKQLIPELTPGINPQYKDMFDGPAQLSPHYIYNTKYWRTINEDLT